MGGVLSHAMPCSQFPAFLQHYSTLLNWGAQPGQTLCLKAGRKDLWELRSRGGIHKALQKQVGSSSAKPCPIGRR